MLLWADIETTGLSANKNDLLEVAAIITTDAFVEVARIQRTVYYQHAATIVELLDAGRTHEEIQVALTPTFPFGCTPDVYVLKMHDKNGLWRDCVNGLALDTVDRDLAAFVKTYGITTEEVVDGKTGEKKTRQVPPQLAGSTISFDRGFINAHLPRLADEKVLHYRNLDVSTLNEIAKRCWPDMYNARPNAGRAKENATHRGMADIEESITVFHHYRNWLDGAMSFKAAAGLRSAVVRHVDDPTGIPSVDMNQGA